jgi:hypothetical protein
MELDLSDKINIEGYLLCINKQSNNCLILIKTNTNSWKTEWFNINDIIHITPTKPIREIFTKTN